MEENEILLGFAANSETWRIEDNKLIHDNLADKLEDLFYVPFPKHFWNWNNKLETELLPEALKTFWYQPVLPFMWYFDGRRLKHDLLPKPIVGIKFIYNGNEIETLILNEKQIETIVYNGDIIE